MHSVLKLYQNPILLTDSEITILFTGHYNTVATLFALDKTEKKSEYI